MSRKTPVSLGSTPSGRPQLKSVTAANATPGKSVPQAHATSGSTQFKSVPAKKIQEQPKKKGNGVPLGQKNKPQT